MMESEAVPLSQLVVEALKEFLGHLSFWTVVGTFVVICVTTRTWTQFTSSPGNTTRYPDGSISPHKVPYWVPYIGHWLSFGFFRRRLLFNARLPERGAAFSFYCWGKRQIVLTTPSMVRGLFEQRRSTSPEPCINYLLDNVFGGSKRMRKPGREGTCHDKSAEWLKLITEEPHLADLSSLLVKEIELGTPALVSFVSSAVDQNQWERISGVTLSTDDNGDRVCITNLYSLVGGFVGSISINLLMGKTLLEVYPNILPDLSIFNSKLNAMLLGIQRWIPFPGLVNAYLARRRLLVCLTVYNTVFSQLEKGQEPQAVWRDMDDVSAAIQARMRARLKNGYSAEHAASEDLSFLWAITTRANALVFWNLVHVLADSALYAKLLREIAPHAALVRVDPKETGFGLPEPPRVSLKIDKLMTSCPLLTAVQKEINRLYSSSFTYRKVTSDINLTECTTDACFASRRPETYRLARGDFIVIPHSLRNMDSLYWESPNTFNPQRHICGGAFDATNNSDGEEMDQLAPQESSSQEKSPRSPSDMDEGPSAGWDDPASICHKLVQRTTTAMLVAILVTWDIRPANGESWEVPNRSNGSLVDEPRDIQVRLRMKT